MEYRILGKTGLRVSLLGMGGLFVSRVGGNDRDEARRAVHRAFELGVNYVDTAPTYANSEEVLGYALQGAKPYYLSTKLGGRPEPFNAQDADGLRYSIEESLRLLHRDYVDILIIHEPDRPGQYDWWTDYDQFLGPVNDVLDDLKRQGTIKFTGLGGTTAYEMPRILATGRYDVVLTAFNYSLLWREAEIAVLPEAKKQGMGIIVGSPLQQGALARMYEDEVRSGAPWLSPPRRRQYIKLYELVHDSGMPLAEMALRFVISNPDISTTLMGARSQAEVELNVAAVEKGPLSPALLARLQEIADMVPFRPFEEPFGLPFGRKFVWPGWAGH
jgi:aryl-alcohol dehydrogenase-like predicted oxidoreductase